MTNQALQFVFSLFSLVGVVGIIFYLILQKTKLENLHEQVEDLEAELQTLKTNTTALEEKPQSTTSPESSKEKIIELYEQGNDIDSIEKVLTIPKATIEMVLKFHTMNKTDNWRDSVN